MTWSWRSLLRGICWMSQSNICSEEWWQHSHILGRIILEKHEKTGMFSAIKERTLKNGVLFSLMRAIEVKIMLIICGASESSSFCNSTMRLYVCRRLILSRICCWINRNVLPLMSESKSRGERPIESGEYLCALSKRYTIRVIILSRETILGNLSSIKGPRRLGLKYKKLLKKKVYKFYI